MAIVRPMLLAVVGLALLPTGGLPERARRPTERLSTSRTTPARQATCTLWSPGVDLRALPEEQRFAEIAQLGQCLMWEVGHVVPALPVPLVTTALLAPAETGLSDLQLDDAVRDLMRRLKSVGAYVLIPSHGQQVGNVGLKMLMQRHLVAKEGGVYRLNRSATALLAFYANSIAHLLAEP
jgi:glycerol-3-phosphate O-acyltransferase